MRLFCESSEYDNFDLEYVLLHTISLGDFGFYRKCFGQ